MEYFRLAQDTDDVEAQEARLLKDLTGQLSKCFLVIQTERYITLVKQHYSAYLIS